MRKKRKEKKRKGYTAQCQTRNRTNKTNIRLKLLVVEDFNYMLEIREDQFYDSIADLTTPGPRKMRFLGLGKTRIN